MLPQLFQDISYATQTLDHCYSPCQDSYNAVSCHPFGKSDHVSILLLPTHRQKLKQEACVVRTAQRWSEQLESMLQDCFDYGDWEMFRVASKNIINIYTDLVTGFKSNQIVFVT
jgi:hypothetical protein